MASTAFALTRLCPARCARLCCSARWTMMRALSPIRSEEHTSELQSLMRISYAVFCLKKKKNTHNTKITTGVLTTVCHTDPDSVRRRSHIHNHTTRHVRTLQQTTKKTH